MAQPFSQPMEIIDNRRHGFSIVYNTVVDSLGKIIGPFGHAIYMSLLRHCNAEYNAWPSLTLIAKEWNISKRQVIRSLKVLEDLKVIDIKRDEGIHNIYHINDPSVWELPGQIGTGDCESPVNPEPVTVSHQLSPSTGDCESPPPVTVSHPKNTHTRIPKEIHLSEILFEEIIKANPYSRLKALSPKQKQVTISKWAEDIDKLIRIDKQNPSIVEEVIKKATHDGFWGRNVLSGDALRRNWDKLTHSFVPKNTEPLFTGEKDKSRKSYTCNKDGQWYLIEDGNQIEVDESSVPESIRDKAGGKAVPPMPVNKLIQSLSNKLKVPSTIGVGPSRL